MTELEELAKQAKRDYNRQWRQNNPDKVKKHNETYWLKKAAKLQQQRAEARA